MSGFNPISDGPVGDYGSGEPGVVLKYQYAESLLPANATKQEKDIELSGARLSDIDHPLRHLFDADNCPANLLPWLAWSLSVDEWQSNWPEDRKRETIKNAILTHAIKGTIESIRNTIRYAGYGEVTITEGETGTHYDGQSNHDGVEVYNSAGHWADYRVFMLQPVSNSQSESLRRILENTAPARCKLVELDFTLAAHLYDNTIVYDGAFNYGST